MAIGALIGGLVQRAGEKSYEAQQQKRNEDLYRQKLQADYLIDDLKTNWDYLDEAGRASRYGLLEPLLGMKKGELGNMATFAGQIHSILPPIATKTAPDFPVTSTRRSLDQLPTPGETMGTSAPIMQGPSLAEPRTTQLSQIPAVRKIEVMGLADEINARNTLSRLESAGVDPAYLEAAKVNLLTRGRLNVLPMEIAQLRVQSQAERDRAKSADQADRSSKLVSYRVPGVKDVQTYTFKGGKLYDTHGVETSLPPGSIPLKQGFVTSTDDQGNFNIIDPQAAVEPGNYRAQISGAGRKTQPRQSPASSQKLPGSDLTPSQISIANRLSDQYARDTKDFVVVRDQFQKINTVASSPPSPAGDLSLIFSYMKILDPPSVVREGEQATAANARGVPETVRNLYNSIILGQRLTETQRKDFAARAQQLYSEKHGNYKVVADQYRKKSRTAGVPEDYVVYDLSVPGADKPSSGDAKQQLIEYLKQKQQQLGGRR